MKFQLFQGDATEVMKTIPSSSVDLVVTSPPYNAGKSYEEKLTDEEYYRFVLPVAMEFKRVLKNDGRFAVNIITNINRINGDDTKDVLFPFFGWIDALRTSGLRIKENIIWNQWNSGCETAWGSWKSPSAPHIRHKTENILLGYNNVWKKESRGESDLTEKEFMGYTIDEWSFAPENDRSHPAPFPIELPKRAIKLFSFKGDTVLDPFLGSGTTMMASLELGRSCIGIELDPKYVIMTKNRLNWGSSLSEGIEWEYHDLLNAPSQTKIDEVDA